jgi:hypothetical protein
MRDLSKKGRESRQLDYAERTAAKAIAIIGRARLEWSDDRGSPRRTALGQEENPVRRTAPLRGVAFRNSTRPNPAAPH